MFSRSLTEILFGISIMSLPDEKELIRTFALRLLVTLLTFVIGVVVHSLENARRRVDDDV